jgi:hypothetical protein
MYKDHIIYILCVHPTPFHLAFDKYNYYKQKWIFTYIVFLDIIHRLVLL